MNPHLIEHAIPLSDKNWFQTGGPARYFATPTTAVAFQRALSWAHEKKADVFVLGCGANILIADTGFDGLVIQPHNKTFSIDVQNNGTAFVTAGAGFTIHELIATCLDNHIYGLEEFSGIPATVGGAVYGNLHYFAHNLGQFLTQATVINRTTGALQQVNTDWCTFGYDSSRLQKNDYYVIDATFKLQAGSAMDAAFARGRSTEIIRHREKRYPTTHTCGSFFRNLHPDVVSTTCNGKKMTAVAYYLDKLGIKGSLSHGDAIVSWQHANMFINRGNATSDDIIQLARDIQEKAYATFGIMPQPECEFVGFSAYPLHA